MRRSKIEIEFTIPVELSDEQHKRLLQLVIDITKDPNNQREGHIHWVFGWGDKPSYSIADLAMLGKPHNPDAPPTGEPEFDESVLHIETATRERRPEDDKWLKR